MIWNWAAAPATATAATTTSHGARYGLASWQNAHAKTEPKKQTGRPSPLSNCYIRRAYSFVYIYNFCCMNYHYCSACTGRGDWEWIWSHFIQWFLIWHYMPFGAVATATVVVAVAAALWTATSAVAFEWDRIIFYKIQKKKFNWIVSRKNTEELKMKNTIILFYFFRLNTE